MLGKVLKSKLYIKGVIFKCTLEDVTTKIKIKMAKEDNTPEENKVNVEEDVTKDNTPEENTKKESETTESNCNFVVNDCPEDLKDEDFIRTDVEEIKEDTSSEDEEILNNIKNSVFFKGISSLDRIFIESNIDKTTLETMKNLTKKVALEMGFILESENIKECLDRHETLNKNVRFYKIKELRKVLKEDFTFTQVITDKLLNNRYIDKVDIDKSLDDASIILLKNNNSFLSIRSSDDDYTIRFYSYSNEENNYIVIEEKKVIKYKE